MFPNYTEQYGDILTIKKGIIVQGVNCRGVMGAGLAKQIRAMYPQVYNDYYKLWSSTKQPYDLLGTNVLTEISDDLIIASGFTQPDYGSCKDYVYADYDAIKSVFEEVDLLAKNLDMPVYLPKIGAGLANGNWDIISRTIKSVISPEVKYTLIHF